MKPSPSSRHHPQPAVGRKAWEDDFDKPAEPFHTFTRDEAQALMQREQPLSPWRVVVVQCAVGVVVAMLAWLTTGAREGAWSALYGAACVVVPAAVLARGVTSRFSNATPGLAAVTFMVWQGVKLAVSVAMLMLAPRLVPGLNWLALLAGLVVCIKVYWVALLWRDPSKDAEVARAVAASRKNAGIDRDRHGR